MTTDMPGAMGAGAQEEVVAELSAFLRIPSISTLSAYKGDIARAAQWVADYLAAAGLDHAQVIPTARHPLVYADWLRAPDQPTVLIYGHYDVQPPEPLDAWQSPPFEPTVRDGNIYARGAADDKGQLFIHMRAVADLLRTTGALPVNVRFLIEGEEEVSGESIDAYVRTHPADLACDAVLISDSPMFAPGIPTICVGLRGAVFGELRVQTGRHDLHSGLYGGAGPNAVEALAHILAGLKTPDGRVQIPGFYEAVRPISAEERAQWAALPFDETAYREHEIGAPALIGEPGYSVLERTWARPTFDANGILGGFTGEGSKAIIPAQAMAKISMRLVPDQDPEAIVAAFRQQVAALCPPGATAEVEIYGAGAAVLLPTDTPVMRAAAQALATVFDRPPVFTRLGGSIPIVSLFAQALHAPVVLMGFGLPDDNLHAPNEKMHLANVFQGLAASAEFLRRLHR